MILRLTVLAIVAASWQMAGSDETRLGLPTFTATVAALGPLIADGLLIDGLWKSNQALVVGFLLSVCVSLPLGIVLGNVPLLNRLAEPYLTILLALPMIAAVPVVQITFGLTLWARVAIIFLFAFTYMTVNVTVGVRSVDHALREMARSFGASRLQTLRYVILPGAVPAIMAGVRLGLGRSLLGMVVAELTLVGAGVGSLISNFESLYQTASVLAVIVVILLEGVLLMEVARRFEIHLGAWRGSSAVE